MSNTKKSPLDVTLTPAEHSLFAARIARENPDWAKDQKKLDFITREFAYLFKRGLPSEGRPIFARGELSGKNGIL